jgi:hypothetical protein
VRGRSPSRACKNRLSVEQPSLASAYAFDTPVAGLSKRLMGTIVSDRPILVGERVSLHPAEGGSARDCEVVAIEPTERDGQVAATEDYTGSKLPIWRGRITLRPVG